MSDGPATTLARDTSRSEQALSPAVELRSVTRVFGLVPGVVRVDVRVERGEVVVLRGPNGAGKTTLLRIAATALSPTYGAGTVLGFDLVLGREEIRRRSELVGPRTRLYEDLTAAENLRFACALHGLDASTAPAALGRAGLRDAGDERVRGYSQGMRQRLALARAALRRPELLLLDDPYAGLDERGRALADGLVAETRAEGGTVFVATHDALPGGLATRTLDMEGGRLTADRPA